MMQTFNIPCPPKPVAGWTDHSTETGEGAEEPVIDGDENDYEVDISIDEQALSDAELYADMNA